AKAEIFEGIEPGGAAIIPADNAQFDRLRRSAKEAGVARTLSFGAANGTDARLLRAETKGSGQNIVADIAGRPVNAFIGATGTHIALNATAALLALHEMGADLDAGAAALAEFAALKGRGARVALGGIELIDESYNANPASMAAALESLGQTAPKD